MDKIDIFDRYLREELSDEERKMFLERLKSDEELESDFHIYSLSVVGICKEAEQDNADFGKAMKQLSKKQLFEIIGRHSDTISNEAIVKALKSHYISENAQIPELTAAAALNGVDDDDQYYEDENSILTNTRGHNTAKEKNGESLRRFTILFFVLIIILIAIGCMIL